MFRTAVRQFARSIPRAAGTVQELTMAEIECSSRKIIDISRAQGVANRGFVDGKLLHVSRSFPPNKW